ncbi:hypothetical protein [Flavobacterium collinsii]|uniref:hypothetical protein n=1 Tax=Flavobacterium collinsii TaxID=1114861 RepID=UPI0024937650|nr:hypothetical protein [Flavobacterium collinsii]
MEANTFFHSKFLNKNGGHWSDQYRAQSDNTNNDTPPDDVTVGANGKVTNVLKNNKPNRFFDENGNQLKPNDAENDTQFLEFEWHVGDQFFNPISISTMFKFILKAGVMPSGLAGGGRYLATGLQSHQAADFGYNQLMEAYNENYKGSEYSGNIGNGTFYRFQGTNTLYNLSDAGNFLWGAWMSFNNFSYGEVWAGSHLNSIITFNGIDTASDQRAIKNGFNYIKK